jgi:hypothetical protein
MRLIAAISRLFEALVPVRGTIDSVLDADIN